MESTFKATGNSDPNLRVRRRDGTRVLFQAVAANDTLMILTTPIMLTRPPWKMFALTVTGDAGDSRSLVPAQPGVGDAAASSDTKLLSKLEEKSAPPQDSGELANDPSARARFVPTFSDVNGSVDHVRLSSFAKWMGHLRELGTIQWRQS